ncbi:MAG: transcriptional repressor [Tissierellia bacterium]|jgi:Fur family ferric uptake transcriptional regulator|nr:transcriptional repressor [Tissierellia bacterium]
MENSPVLTCLKEHGYKLTEPRRRIAEVLESTKVHYRIEELYDMVNKDGFLISQATIYRTVRLLEELNLLAKIDLGDGLDRYELRVTSHHHHHLLCYHCKKIQEVQGDFLDELEERLEEIYDFSIQDHDVVFYGTCSQCKNRMEKNE